MLLLLVGNANTTQGPTYDGKYGSGVYGSGAYGATFYQPGSITDPQTVGAPTATFTPRITPASINDPTTIATPTLSANWRLVPDTLNDTDVPGGPTITAAYGITPASISDPETVGVPDVSAHAYITVDTIADPETIATPDAEAGNGGTPDTITDAETFDPPTAVFAPAPPFPDDIADPETLGTPGAAFHASLIAPVGITDPQAIGAPGKTFRPFYNGAYGSGSYGYGIYQGMTVGYDGINDGETVGQPSLTLPPPVPTNIVLPLGITDTETVGEPTATKPGATNLIYGAGTYGDGTYFGTTPTTPQDNIAYGAGTYGYGVYYGLSEPSPPLPPIFVDVMAPPRPPLHILGIGPWSSHISWCGAPNYGVPPGNWPARPVLALPATTSKSFTLRLGVGSEARLEMSFSRGGAIILEEMDTDLWWRRKDPRTQRLEMVGRFNVSHLDLATSDTGISCSVQLDDYQTILGARLVLKYLNPTATPPTSMWDIGTSVSSIIGWALPDNTGLDLTEAKGPGASDIGTLTQPFDLAPGTSIDDLMDNLLPISTKKWEWWIDTPLDTNLPPRLRLVAGERGTDRGVTLFDVGKGPTPIASWTRNGAEGDYANTIYYSGGTKAGQNNSGGVVEDIPAQVAQYGQRDKADGNSSVDGGDATVLRLRANAMLEKLADRRPSFTINLRQGFWRGRHHIDIGDTITLVLRMGKELIHDKYRVSEINVNIDDLGLEDVTLHLGRLPVSADPRSKRSPFIRLIKYLQTYVPPDRSMDLPTAD
jgi:hypothetical protein